MPQEAKISLIGMIHWNNDLFSEMSWPTPFTGEEPEMDQDTFLDELLSQTGELELIYTDPSIMQHLIGSWSRTRLAVWNHLWDTTQYTYNPIENYDRIEDGTDMDTHSGTDTSNNTTTRTGTDTDTHSGTDTHSNTLNRTGSESDTHSGTDTHSNSLTRTGSDSDTHSGTDQMQNTHTKSGTDTNTTTNKQEQWKAAYDSAAAGNDDGLVKVERNEGTGQQSTLYNTSEGDSGSTTHGHVITHGFNSGESTQGSDVYGHQITHGFNSGESTQGSDVYGHQITHGFNSGESNNGSTVFGHKITTKHDLHVHGNIGTVTAQKMITEERELAMFNLYDMMIQDFKDRFLVLVY